MGGRHLFQARVIALATPPTWPQMLASHRKPTERSQDLRMGDLYALEEGI